MIFRTCPGGPGSRPAAGCPAPLVPPEATRFAQSPGCDLERLPHHPPKGAGHPEPGDGHLVPPDLDEQVKAEEVALFVMLMRDVGDDVAGDDAGVMSVELRRPLPNFSFDEGAGRHV